jgi:hypothetical protein
LRLSRLVRRAFELDGLLLVDLDLGLPSTRTLPRACAAFSLVRSRIAGSRTPGLSTVWAKKSSRSRPETSSATA